MLVIIGAILYPKTSNGHLKDREWDPDEGAVLDGIKSSLIHGELGSRLQTLGEISHLQMEKLDQVQANRTSTFSVALRQTYVLHARFYL